MPIGPALASQGLAAEVAAAVRDVEEARATLRKERTITARKLMAKCVAFRLVKEQQLEAALEQELRAAVRAAVNVANASKPRGAATPELVAHFAAARPGLKYESLLMEAAAHFKVDERTVARHIKKAREKNLMT